MLIQTKKIFSVSVLIFQDFFQDKTAIRYYSHKIDSINWKAIDVMHLVWNIGKTLGKRSYTAEFIKKYLLIP